MGLKEEDEMAVVESDFIVTAVYMISEKASDVILADVTAGMGFVRRMIGRVTRRGTLGGE
jgi:hypothetical protein